MNQDIIKVGDEASNPEGHTMKVEAVTRGQYGLLVSGHFTCHNKDVWRCFVIPELEPVEQRIKPWQGWAGRFTITLASGLSIGVVSIWLGDNLQTVEDFDAKWKYNLESRFGQQPEPMQSRPTDIKLNG